MHPRNKHADTIFPRLRVGDYIRTRYFRGKITKFTECLNKNHNTASCCVVCPGKISLDTKPEAPRCYGTNYAYTTIWEHIPFNHLPEDLFTI